MNAISRKSAIILVVITWYIHEYRAERKSSGLDVNNPKTWADLAKKKFKRFQNSVNFKSTKRPRNIILFVGDGMSLNTQAAARFFKAYSMGFLAGDVNLVWDDWETVGLLRTFSADQMTTDSAASGTALFNGK